MRRAIHALDASALFCVPLGELSLVVLDAAAMGRVHADFLDDPSPTDVITFDGDPAFGAAGEVCVCADVARGYAAEHGGGFSRELTLYLVHGYLHLAGFDDTRPALKRRMRAAERRAMAVLEAARIAVDRIAAWK
ncbi:MAG: rRNA maturation RNase YbeY [Opitutaceae bacterium]|nr:rRNA maturation RNase YbeY [Opitutaceae bacterium]